MKIGRINESSRTYFRNKELWRGKMVRIPTNRPPTHPGEMLMEEFLKPLKMTQVELAEKLGVSYPRVNELIHKKRGVTPDTALRLEQLFGMEAQFWLNLQLSWDLYQVAHSPLKKEIRKIKLLPELAQAVNG
jgi:addiction module HigA family antidote